MTDETFSDEVLMRFADGELDPETMAAVEAAMESDDLLVARLAVFIETRALAQESLRPLLDEPVPEALAASVNAMIAAKRRQAENPPANVLPFASREARPVRRWVLPLAASLAAAIGGLAGYWAAMAGNPGESGLSIAGPVGPALNEALDSSESGREVRLAGGERFRAIGTFRNQASDVCREFEVDLADSSTVISVACISDKQWMVTFAVSAPSDAGGYAPASSTEALDAYLAAIDAAPPMSVEEEAQVLAQARAER